MEITIKDVTPLYSRIIVEKEDDDMVAGIYIPDSAKKGDMNSLRGKVVAVGDEADRMNVGDIILFGQYSGTKFKIGEKSWKQGEPSYLIMNQEDVLCKITKDGNE